MRSLEIYLHVVNYVDNLHFCQPKSLLGCQVVEESDEVVDILLTSLHIEEEQARVDEVETGDRGGLRVCGSCQALGGISSGQVSALTSLISPTLISFSQTAPSIAL